MAKKCLCITYFLKSQRGGIQTYLRYLGKGLRQRGWEVETIFLDDVVSSSILRGRSWLSKFFRSSSFLRSLLDCQRISSTKNLLISLANRVEKSVLEQKPDVVHVQDAYAGYAVLPIVQANKIPLIVTNHGPIMREAEFGSRYKEFVNLMEKTTYQNAKAIILVGEHLKSAVLSKASDTPYFIIHNAIDIDDFLARGQKEYPNLPQNYILIVARLDPEKGVDVGLKAFQKVSEKYPDLSLVVVGDGRLKGELQKLAFDLNVANHIHFLGWVFPDDISSIYRKAKIVWVTSKPIGNIQEPLGIVALEASAWGRPIIASKTGGLAEIFIKGGGLLVSPNDPEALSKATIEILSDPFLAEKISKEASEMAKKDYDINSWTQKVLNVYNSVLK